MSSSVSNKAYIKVVIELQRMFAETYRDGGWLPGGREMAQKLGVSHRTYWKAINCMVAENFVKSYHGVGYYVIPDRERCHKIGIIFNDGSESPFISNCDDFAKCLQYLNRHKLNVHVIQGTQPAQLHENAVAHGVEGVIWLQPSPSALPYIRQWSESGDLPAVVVNWGRHIEDVPGCCTRFDYYKIGCKKAEFALQRGHCIIFSDEKNSIVAEGIQQTMKRSGVDVDYHIFSDIWANQDHFIEMVEKLAPTMFLLSGGPQKYNKVAKLLEPLLKKPIEILVYLGDDQLDDVVEIPLIKLYREHDETCLHEIAAEILVDHLHHGKPLRNVCTEATAFTVYSSK